MPRTFDPDDIDALARQSATYIEATNTVIELARTGAGEHSSEMGDEQYTACLEAIAIVEARFNIDFPFIEGN